MNKTKLTIALMSSMAVTSAFATTGTEVNNSITKYSEFSMAKTKEIIPGADASIVYRSSTLVNNLVNDSNVQKHIATSLIADKTAGLKAKAEAYEASSIEKKERKKAKYNEKAQATKDAKGWSKVKAFKEEVSAKIELEKQRGRVNAAKKAVAELNKFENDGFFKEQYELANGIRVDFKNGFNAYNEQLVNPSKVVLGDAWTAATKFDYVDYTKNIHDFWNVRMNVWTDGADLSKDARAFNELTNVATIEALAQIKGEDTAAAIKDYANANELAFQVTTLGNSEQAVMNVINNKVGTPGALYGFCATNATQIADNKNVQNAVNTINQLGDKDEIAKVIDVVLAKIGIDNDYTIINLKATLGNIGAQAIATIIGSDGVIFVDKDLNLKVDITGLAAQPVAEAIADNSIYKEVIASQNLVVGTQTCNYEAVSTSNTKVGKALMAATNYYANAIAKETGAPVDAATKSNVLMALEGTMYENINKIK
ncbi:hypothetical protein QIW49_08295 [Francisellaceae bacterium CB300]|jgi:hypothetical protein